MKLLVSKLVSMVDEALEIKVVDIPNNERVIIKAEMIDEIGNHWNSEGIYYGYAKRINT